MAENNMPVSQKKKFPTWAWWIVGIIGAIVLVLIGYYIAANQYRAQNMDLQNQIDELQNQELTNSSDQEAGTSTTSSESKESTNVYLDDFLGFSLDIPENYGYMRQISMEGGKSVMLNYGEKDQENAYTMPGGGSDYIRITDLSTTPPTQSSLSEEVESYRKDHIDIYDESDMTIDGQDAKIFGIGGLCSGIHVISYKQPYRLDAEIYCASQEDEDFLLDMLKTFRWPE